MTADRDRLGFYAALGVPPDADASALRDAYRARIKAVHPDRNAAPDASAHFQTVHQAYQVLGDPDGRARYDAWHRDTPAGEPVPPEFLPVLTCERCGQASPHLRVIVVHWVWSALFFTRHGHTPYLACPACGTRLLAVASVKAGLFGWWGVPFGPLLTPVTLWKNLTAPMPAEVNVPMLLHRRSRTRSAASTARQGTPWPRPRGWWVATRTCGRAGGRCAITCPSTRVAPRLRSPGGASGPYCPAPPPSSRLWRCCPAWAP